MLRPRGQDLHHLKTQEEGRGHSPLSHPLLISPLYKERVLVTLSWTRDFPQSNLHLTISSVRVMSGDLVPRDYEAVTYLIAKEDKLVG